MTIEWCRLWHDMPTDPKFRAVAKRAGRPTSEVVALFTAMMTNASANDDDRGTLRNWSHEDMAVALDMEPEHAEAIYQAMQGKLLEGERLLGWERRQTKREDGSAERAKAWRERKRTQTNASERDQTETNENERKRALDSDTDTDTDTILAQSVEQDPAREAIVDAKAEPKNNFDSKRKIGTRAKSSTDVDTLDSIVKRAEGFLLDVDAVRDLIRKNKPSNPAGYAITLFANDLKARVPLAAIETCVAAMRGKTDAQKVVYEAMTR